MWVRNQGMAVIACTGDELDLARTCGVNPRHVVLRCSPMTATIRHGAALGVVRGHRTVSFPDGVDARVRPAPDADQLDRRISRHLAAGSTQQLAAIASAMDEGCSQWRLPRPAVALAPVGT
jgi:hypothetical protein